MDGSSRRVLFKQVGSSFFKTYAGVPTTSIFYRLINLGTAFLKVIKMMRGLKKMRGIKKISLMKNSRFENGLTGSLPKNYTRIRKEMLYLLDLILL